MTIKALVVDDSVFFRRMITRILSDSPEFSVVGGASNGLEAVELVKKLQPDIVTMDVAMPVMDGITAVRKIMSTHPTPILMLSALTERGAQATLEALEAGALDFMPKRMADISRTNAEAESLFRSRIRALARRPLPGEQATKPAARSNPSTARAVAPTEPTPKPKANERPAAVRLVAIGASTGGPLACSAHCPRTFRYRLSSYYTCRRPSRRRSRNDSIRSVR
jgi:two-component system chemotaxis response regulator CheB